MSAKLGEMLKELGKNWPSLGRVGPTLLQKASEASPPTPDPSLRLMAECLRCSPISRTVGLHRIAAQHVRLGSCHCFQKPAGDAAILFRSRAKKGSSLIQASLSKQERILTTLGAICMQRCGGDDSGGPEAAGRLCNLSGDRGANLPLDARLTTPGR